MIDEVAADRRVDSHGHGDFQFGADAIGAGNKNGFFPLFVVEGKERAEPADAAENAAGERAVGMVPDALLHFTSATAMFSTPASAYFIEGDSLSFFGRRFAPVVHFAPE